MLAELEPRRVLILVTTVASPPLREHFGRSLLSGWEVLEANSFEQARFVLQHQSCDALLVDESIYKGMDTEGIAWLARQHEVPVLLLARAEPGLLAFALTNGVSHWLPHDLALHHSLLLSAALDQAAHLTDLRRRIHQGRTALQHSRRQVDRLVSLLWRTVPADVQTRWLTQRHMLERFQEEVGRAQRYGDELTVVLGEVQDPTEEGEPFATWLTERITQAKRCCDVAGQYGPHGFMLLLVHTPEAGGLACCRRLQNVLGQPSGPARETPRIGRAYFGIAGFSTAASSCKSLLSRAEQHLATAKTAGEGLGAAI